MKFREDSDKSKLILEIDRIDLLEKHDLTETDFEELLKGRSQLLEKLKDFKKSQASKLGHRRHRWSYRKGIDKFHRSVKGKKFHRNIGKRLATRDRKITLRETAEFLKAVSSLRTHLYIDLDYYRPLTEQADFELFLEETIPILNELEARLLSSGDNELTEEEYELLTYLSDRGEVTEVDENAQKEESDG